MTIHWGLISRLLEGFHELQAFGKLLDLRFRAGLGKILAYLCDFAIEIDGAKQLVDGFRAHPRDELVTVLLDGIQVHLVGHQRAAFQIGHAGIDDDEGLEIENALDIPERHVQQQSHARRQGLQVPDVGHWTGKLDVAHALAAHLGQGHFDAALLADDAAMFEPLVLSAQTFVVLDRTEYLRAEQPVTLRLEGTVVDGLRLLHFTVGPRTDLVR